MSFDLSYFLETVEKEFCVDLLEAPGELNTLNDLVLYLERHTAVMPHSSEEADSMFQDGLMTLRTFLAKELDLNVMDLTSATEIESILKPLTKRRRVWRKLQKEISDNIPSLVSVTYRLIGGIAGFLIGIIVMVSVIFGQNETNPNPLPIAILLGMMAGLIMGLSAYAGGTMLLAPLFSTIPRGCDTLGEMTQRVVPTQICLDPDGQEWTRQSIEQSVLLIASKASGLPVEKISLSMKPLEM